MIAADAINTMRSDHCPAMKGIETLLQHVPEALQERKRPLPRNEGD